MAEKIAVILVDYHNWPDTLACLKSIPNNKNILKVVVEQAAAKNIKYNFPHTKFILSKKNIGFAAANNLGIKYALRQNCTYLFLLNNDTIVNSQTIKSLTEFMQNKSACGICSPVNYFYQSKKVAFSGGKINKFNGLTPHRHDLPKKNRRSGFITGASMFIRSSILNKTGSMSEDYFLYYEDTDFCEKVKRAGYELWVVAGARIEHKVSQTAQVNPFIYYYCQRNRLLFFSRHCPKLLWPIFVLFLFKELLILTLRGLFKPNKNNNLKNLTYSYWGVWDFLLGHKGKNNKI